MCPSGLGNLFGFERRIYLRDKSLFTHLHVHSEYSMLDGLAKISPLVSQASKLGMKSLAITDHGALYGAIDFYREAKKSNIKPIIGCEMYMARGSRFDRNPNEKIHHMTVLAKDLNGYQNLVELVTKAHLEGYYKKPRVDKELLEKHSDGLVVMSGCPSGEIPWLLAQDRYDEALDSANWYKELFGTYFFELMSHGGVPDLPRINQGLYELNKRTGIPLVATNDSHYVLQEHAHNHDVLLCIQTATNINDPNRMRFEDQSYHLKSYEEMSDLFKDTPEAITNTEMVAEMCNLELDFGKQRLPEFPVPERMDSNEYLAQICWEGYKSKLAGSGEEYRKRLEYELSVIKETQFPDYFLVVWDIARFVRENNIFFTVRGSAAASLVLYCLGVTDINPMPFKLVFERFLNLERKEMPDIDMDFQDDRRQEVINYCASRYGREHVAHIITFGTFGAKQSIRDAGRALGMTLDSVDKVARMIPDKLNIGISESLEQSVDLKTNFDSSSETQTLIETAKQLEGVTRHKSLHAAGVVISKEPLNEVVPLEFTSRGDDAGAVMTQYAMDPLADLGLLKMDFLGLVNLTVLDQTVKSIEANFGTSIKLSEIPLDDRNAFDLLSRGETVGIFQLESAGMTRYIKELKPSSLGDVAAMIALFRPGPMEHIGTFIDGKHGRRDVTYVHPALKDILEETYGVIVYQDQVLHIAREFAGYSLGEADIVRKAMGKKVPEIMAEEKEKFLSGALGKGHSAELAETVFDLVEPFAGYAFNKAHSVSYGLVSYWTAYFKANYPAEYMASFMNSYMDNKDRLISAVADCRRMGIEVLPPDINKSQIGFKVESVDSESQSIRFGLAAVKNVGSEALRPVIEARDDIGVFDSIESLCKLGNLANLNRKAIESLIMAGAFDDFGDRAGILEVSDRISSLAQEESHLKNSNQSSMFDMFGETVESSLSQIEIPVLSSSDQQKRIWEVELMGISISAANNLEKLLHGLDDDTYVMVARLRNEKVKGRITLGGQVSTVVDRMTRDNRPFKVVTMELLDGSVEVVVWEDVLAKTVNLWEPGKLLEVRGNVREREGDITVSIHSGVELDLKDVLNGGDRKKVSDMITETFTSEMTKMSYPDGSTPSLNNSGSQIKEIAGNQNETSTNKKKLILHIKESSDEYKDKMMLDDLKRLLLNSSGTDDVALEIETPKSLVFMEWYPVKVSATNELESDLNSVLNGSGRVTIQSSMF